MNDIVNAHNTDSDIALTPIPIMQPEKYVADIFDPFKKKLAKVKKTANATAAYDITTTAGMGIAKELRASFRDIRTSAENERKMRKAPIIQVGKLLDARYAELEGEIRPFEDKYDAQIKAEELRKAEEKQEKERQERARIEAIENRIAHIRNATVRHLKSDSAAIAKEIEQYTVLRLDPADYQELLEDALNAVNKTLDDLEAMRLQAVAREEAEKKAEADRIELARLKAEADARAKQDLQEKAQRAADERARADAAAEAAAANAKLIADLQAQLAAAQKQPEPVPTAAPQAELQINVPAPSGTDVQVLIDTSRDSDDGILTRDGVPVNPVQAEIQKTVKPGEPEIIMVVALYFSVRAAVAIDWMAAIDYDKARAALAGE